MTSSRKLRMDQRANETWQIRRSDVLLFEVAVAAYSPTISASGASRECSVPGRSCHTYSQLPAATSTRNDGVLLLQ